MARRGRGPCGCFGITLERGSQLFAIFDVITGLLLFTGFVYILLAGELRPGDKKFYPSEKFNMPRELVITFIFLGYYNGTTGLFLYFIAGCRKRIGCIIWIILNTPLVLVDLLKIYQIVVVYMLSKEIKLGKVENIKSSDEDDEKDDVPEEKKSSKIAKCFK